MVDAPTREQAPGDSNVTDGKPKRRRIQIHLGTVFVLLGIGLCLAPSIYQTTRWAFYLWNRGESYRFYESVGKLLLHVAFLTGSVCFCEWLLRRRSDRQWLQLRLTTCLALMTVTGILMCLNFVSEGHTIDVFDDEHKLELPSRIREDINQDPGNQVYYGICYNSSIDKINEVWVACLAPSGDQGGGWGSIPVRGDERVRVFSSRSYFGWPWRCTGARLKIDSGEFSSVRISDVPKIVLTPTIMDSQYLDWGAIGKNICVLIVILSLVALVCERWIQYREARKP